MKTIFKTFLLLLLSFTLLAGQDDTLRIQLSGGPSLSLYDSNKIKISNNPVGYRFGLGISKRLNHNFVFASNIWFQNIVISGIKTDINDQYYHQNVHLTTDINFQQMGLSCEIYKDVSKFLVGINTGIAYLIKSNTKQLIDIENNTGTTNIYQKYIIYDYQKDSFYSAINPYIGISINYFPSTKFGIKYENNFSIIATPYENYQYIQKFHLFTHQLMLIFNLK